MKYLSLFISGTLLSLSAFAADFACMEDCYRRGNAPAYCQSVCGGGGGMGQGGMGQGGMMEQPGLPKNPGFDQMQPRAPQPAQRFPAATDSRCMKDCNRKGYDYLLCQKQCSYSLYGQ